MKKSILVVLAVGSLTLYNCKVDKKGDIEMPEVAMDVDVEEGNLPSFDVDWADVNVGTKTKMVKVPKVRVVVEEEEVEVPYIDVDMPDSDEMSIAVEAEVSDVEHEIKISEIRASNKRLYVISKLTKKDTNLNGEVLRVQDQIELNAPDLDVKHIIVGEKPNRSFNSRYSYISDMNMLPENAKDAKVIYKR